MWITIEATANYTFRARTISDGTEDGIVACMLIVTDNATGALSSSQFVLGVTAEMIQAGW